MVPVIDFLRGGTRGALGVERVEEQLLGALTSQPELEIRPIRFSPAARLWFPFLYTWLPLRLRLRHADLLHFANSWQASIVPFMNKPVVVTCHDLIEIENLRRGQLRASVHRRFHLRAALRGMLQARFIVCISQSVADIVVREAPGHGNRVRVVHSGVSNAFTPGSVDDFVLQAIGVERPFILYVGSDQPRKNLLRLCTALGQLRGRIPNLMFVKVGSHQTQKGRADLLHALATNRLEDRTVILERISDTDLAQLYRAASLTVLPSLEEGFGFPALEAMACGCPTVLAGITSLHEVGGDAAVFVDPYDVLSIARGIERLLQDSELRAELVQRGLARASEFTWEKAAHAYAQIYAEALSATPSEVETQLVSP